MPNHIDKKDKADNVTKIIGDMLEETKQRLLNVSFSKLLLYQGKTPENWYIKQTSNLRAFRLEINKSVALENKRLLNAVKQGSKEVELTSKQTKEHQKLINRGINDLKNVVVSQHISNISSIYASAKVIKSNVADPLFDAISKQIDRTQRTGVTYKDGKTYKWENYLEMKLRTDIQNEITNNLVKASTDAGLIFFVASYYGDCAPDHADYQGKIYVVDGWETIAPKKRHDEIDAYIKAHKIMTVEEVTNTAPYLTTRPNCRHFLQPLSIDEVLGITNDKELNNKRASLDMNAHGKYKPEKYEALSKQRYNERQIRHWKEVAETKQRLLDNAGASVDSTTKQQLSLEASFATKKIRQWQKEQRTLMNANTGVLERNYDREAYNRMISDFGMRRNQTK